MCFLTACIAKFLLISHICIYCIERLIIVGIIGETIFSKGYDIVLEIGLNTFKEKIKSVKDQKIIREKLESYLSKKLQENWFCTRDEEIDFEGLANYIREDLIDDMKSRLFGEKEERNCARLRILDKSVAYAQANTKIAKNRVERMVTSLMTMLKDFYRKKVPQEMLLVSGEIVDNLSEHQEEQTRKIIGKITETEKELTKEINKKNLLSTDSNIELMRKGKYAEVEQNLTSAIRAIGAQHPLNQYYRIGVRTVDGKDEAFSCPVSANIPKEYLPKMEFGVRATLGGKDISEFNLSNLNYSFRHQIPFVVNVVKARKLLGDILDPYQHEAEREIGKEYKIYPPRFPAAFSCTLLGDDKPIIEYLLLRTLEILDDETYIVTNQEQKGAPFKIEIRLNVHRNIFNFRIEPSNNKNSEKLLIAKILKEMTDSRVIKLYSLEHAVDLVSGNMQQNSCESMFDTISEDIEFFEKIIDIEKYFGQDIRIPNPIRQDELWDVDYLASLIRGERCEGKWSELTAEFTVNQKMKEFADSEERTHELCFMASGVVPIELWEQLYEIPVKRTFPYITIKNLENVCKKIQVLDLGDPIKISYIPGKSGDIMWDQLALDSNQN